MSTQLSDIEKLVLNVLEEARTPLPASEIETRVTSLSIGKEMYVDNFTIREAIWSLIDQHLLTFTPSREITKRGS